MSTATASQTGKRRPWQTACTLSERLAQLHPADGDEYAAHQATADGERVLRQWRSHKVFLDEHDFRRRLAAEGIRERQLTAILPAEGRVDPATDTPPWYEQFIAAFEEHRSDAPGLSFTESAGDHTADNRAMAGFLTPAAPLIARACRRLGRGMRCMERRYGRCPFDRDVTGNLLLGELAGELAQMLGRVFVLELQVARLEGTLDGGTPEARFRSFVEQLQRPEAALALFEEYPVLARQVVTRIERWLTFSLEFLEHLAADWPEICRTFHPPNDPGQLVDVRLAGDRHRGGRCVVVATWHGGFRVVYKPRPLGVEVQLQQFLRWLNANGAALPFRTLSILDRGHYGWVEFVEPAPCRSPQEVRRFYRRQGANLAVLHALSATDLHCENVIASGEHPVLIDAETLFHPRLQQARTEPADGIDETVLAVGLLPRRSWTEDDGEGVDLSGLGAVENQRTPFAVPRFRSLGTDEARLDAVRETIDAGHSRPTLDGRQIPVTEHTEDLLSGFRQTYALLQDVREELLADGGPLEAFRRHQVRVVVRPTQSYARLVQESFHPDLLRDGLTHDRFFDYLWAAVRFRGELARVFPAERADLLEGDVPLFTAEVGSRDLCSSRGQRFADALAESGLQRARARITRLSGDDLARQTWLLRASLASTGTTAEIPSLALPGSGEQQARPARAELLDAARRTGDWLEQLAIPGTDGVTWGVLQATAADRWSVIPAGLDLYDGLPGIVLFLAHLGSITGEERYAGLARIGFQSMRHYIEQKRSTLRQLGAFNGWGGVVYVLAHLARLWQDGAILDEVEQIAADAAGMVDEDEHFDVISGAAGGIASLLALHGTSGSDTALAAAVRCGDHLLARASGMEQGIGWIAPGMGSRALAGLSHGAAGVAWALCQLAAATGQERFRHAALEAIRYERSLFRPTAGNWIDVRRLGEANRGGEKDEQFDEQLFMTAWCHGAPGIGLARLGCREAIEDDTIAAEVRTAVETTIRSGFGGNHSLCHGGLGNLELVLQAADALNRPDWRNTATAAVSTLLQGIQRHGWQCPYPHGMEVPGLMTGLSGIGYQLLRLAEPQRVPSVLMLQPPGGDLQTSP